MQILGNLAEKLRDYFSKRGYTCDGCGAEIFDYPNHRLCPDCEYVVYENNEYVCPKCGRKARTESVCITCKQAMPAFKQGFSPFVYVGETAALVNGIKNGKRKLGYYFGDQMAKCLLERGRSYLSEETLNTKKQDRLLVLPVPLSKKKLIQRGYNQAEDLGKIVVKRLEEAGIAVELGEADVLIKSKDTAPQKQKKFFERRENMQGSFHVHKRSEVQGRTVLLVDDIMTTGATGNECAKRLKGAGAKQVIFLTAASLMEQK